MRKNEKGNLGSTKCHAKERHTLGAGGAPGITFTLFGTPLRDRSPPGSIPGNEKENK